MSDPSDKSGNFRRWQFDNFGDNRPSTLARIAAEEKARVPMPSKEEVARIRELALQEGFAQGHAQGLDQGLREGRAEGMAVGLNEGRVRAETEIAYLQQLAQDFTRHIAQADQNIAHDLLDLALDIAKAMLKTALQVKPELVLPVIQEAVQYLPGVQMPAHLILHPDDAALIHAQLGDELEKNGWLIIEDEMCMRGGCRIDTPSNQIDASATTRWQRIAAALGKDGDWLA
ncbi:flagellar assembly protein FliH [Massilia sp. W12]|uniref:flagellar assembly protein FliH n=1 Tax=Massilia sp. W12 TaxID=3126507 RepID=UPI0030CC8343